MALSKVILITVDQVISFNKEIVLQENQKHLCLDHRKIESAVAAAFYPGNHPFCYGSIAKVAGALCFFLSKAHGFFDGNKRTAGIAAVTFMNLNHYDLVYSWDAKTGNNEFAHIIEALVQNNLTIKEVMDWFDQHSC